MKRMILLNVFMLTLLAGAARAEIVIKVGPPLPPPREVITVRPGPRHIWIPGHYGWVGRKYVGARGYWTPPPPRPGFLDSRTMGLSERRARLDRRPLAIMYDESSGSGNFQFWPGRLINQAFPLVILFRNATFLPSGDGTAQPEMSPIDVRRPRGS